jgi:hypothetical protein
MERAYDPRTGRPLIGGSDDPHALTDEELQAELTIAAARPRPRAKRLETLLLELARRTASGQPDLPMP